MARPEVQLAIVYDLRDPSGWRHASQHRRLWGRRLTDIHVLDPHHILLLFRSGGERWRPWERARLRWILGTRAVEEEAA
jgi:hypothetical protein